MPTPMATGVAAGVAPRAVAVRCAAVVSGAAASAGTALAWVAVPLSVVMAVRAASRRRFWQERDMVDLPKRKRWERTGLCQPRASSGELLASGKLVISGR